MKKEERYQKRRNKNEWSHGRGSQKYIYPRLLSYDQSACLPSFTSVDMRGEISDNYAGIIFRQREMATATGTPE